MSYIPISRSSKNIAKKFYIKLNKENNKDKNCNAGNRNQREKQQSPMIYS